MKGVKVWQSPIPPSMVPGALTREQPARQRMVRAGIEDVLISHGTMVWVQQIYENVIIGNFLYCLGARMAQLHPNIPVLSPQLFQQAGKADRLLGDVLLGGATTCRLIEFKRKGFHSSKEQKKLNTLQDALRNIGEPESRETYIATSRSLHLFAEISPPEIGHPVEVNVRPYLDQQNRTCPNRDLIAVSEEIAQGAGQGELPPKEREFYLQYLEWISKSFSRIDAQAHEDPRASGERGLNTALRVTTSVDGQVRSIAVPGLEYLLMRAPELAAILDHKQDSSVKKDLGLRPEFYLGL